MLRAAADGVYLTLLGLLGLGLGAALRSSAESRLTVLGGRVRLWWPIGARGGESQ
ncbi:hypothetical protein ABT124_36615 [Streptomyces sp. NPDC001982]|uniref:hypothetical protein n=1 Tax=unclassified Streptomyces TaxID=2593676 RepID=UPI003333EACC